MSDGEALGPESQKEPGLVGPRVIQTLKALTLVLFFWLISTVFGGREDLNWQHVDWSGRVAAIGRDNSVRPAARGFAAPGTTWRRARRIGFGQW